MDTPLPVPVTVAAAIAPEHRWTDWPTVTEIIAAVLAPFPLRPRRTGAPEDVR
ncbi:hypothetical protein [Streptomyces sp. HD]|uniref:hypothetical protein n=1 Tax=Streptomyces sp. HD TaxID=3020892 RepID=UPI0023309D64|nr:hypothetical protein [Streptomyces sp. HD]MDC0771406.1 hypothetical protein [Streptomyces sp. HD]